MTTARPLGARPLPQPPQSQSKSKSASPSPSPSPSANAANADNTATENTANTDAAWYEHEIRPSYIQPLALAQAQAQAHGQRYAQGQQGYTQQGQQGYHQAYHQARPLPPGAGSPYHAAVAQNSGANAQRGYHDHPAQTQGQRWGGEQQQQQQQQAAWSQQDRLVNPYAQGYIPSQSQQAQQQASFAQGPSFAPPRDQPRVGTMRGSAFMHKGFWDIMSLVNNQANPNPSSKLHPSPEYARGGPTSPSTNRIKATLSRATGGLKKAGAPNSPNDPFTTVEQAPAAAQADLMREKESPVPRPYPSASPLNLTSPPSVSSGSLNGPATPGLAHMPPPAIMGPRAAKKRISIDMVGAPQPHSFVHAAHASDAEQAEAILRRWSRDGVGKIADPRWVQPIKDALRQQAARNQAEAIAQVQAALHQDSVIKENPRPLHIVNGTPSASLSVSTMTTTTATAGHSQVTVKGTTTGVAPGTFRSAVGNAPGARAGEAFGDIQEEAHPSDRRTPPASPRRNAGAPPSPATLRPPMPPPNVRTDTAGTMVINQTPTPDLPGNGQQAVDHLDYIPPAADAAAAQAHKAIDGLPGGMPGGIGAMFDPPSAAAAGRPQSMVVLDEAHSVKSAGMSALVRPASPVRPSLTTVEKSVAAKIFFENLYYGILKKPHARETRRAGLESELASLRIGEAAKEAIRAAWVANETEYLRDLRARVNVNSFARLKTIGHGAFGVVSLIRERGTGELFAMKQLRKADMLRKGQEGHVRAERDLMTSASASANARWIVKLVYSFQDVDHLYLIMEFMGGGDLLNLLIEKDIFEEDFARFYVAEMILSINEAHRLGYIHRDIKPDNFLFTSQGHVKLADFGLCQSFHWAHDGAYYDQQRKHLLRKHGIDLEDGNGGGGARRGVAGGAGGRYPATGARGAGGALNEKELGDVMSDRNEDGTPMTHVLTWRDKNKKKIAYSVVGTNNYMAPEVLRGLGYDQSCDWWSLGVIVFEMLFGYPPFVSKSRHLTRQKILNWRQTLRFPPRPRVSREAQDFIERLICEREDRLGSTSSASVSRPNSIIQNARRSGFAAPSANGAPGLQDGADEIMAHPWFRGLDFSSLHTQRAPFRPALSHPADTKHFEDDIEDEPLPAPGAAPAGPTAPGEKQVQPQVDVPRDPMLRDKEHGMHLLEMRKQLAFVGYTFKSPKHFDPRQQLAEGAGADADFDHDTFGMAQPSSGARRNGPAGPGAGVGRQGTGQGPLEGGSRLRSMSM